MYFRRICGEGVFCEEMLKNAYCYRLFEKKLQNDLEMGWDGMGWSYE